MNKEYNYSKHKENILNKYIVKYDTLEKAVISMDAYISSLEIDLDTADDIIETFRKECDHLITDFQDAEDETGLKKFIWCEICLQDLTDERSENE